MYPGLYTRFGKPWRQCKIFNKIIKKIIVPTEAFHGIIVVSLSCTEYHWGSFIVL